MRPQHEQHQNDRPMQFPMVQPMHDRQMQTVPQVPSGQPMNFPQQPQMPLFSMMPVQSMEARQMSQNPFPQMPFQMEAFPQNFQNDQPLPGFPSMMPMQQPQPMNGRQVMPQSQDVQPSNAQIPFFMLPSTSARQMQAFPQFQNEQSMNVPGQAQLPVLPFSQMHPMQQAQQSQARQMQFSPIPFPVMLRIIE